MSDVVELTVVTSEAAAAALVGALRDAGVDAQQLETDFAAASSLGAGGGGPRAILVHASQLERAQDVLAASGLADADA
jgi:hypothetical protein